MIRWNRPSEVQADIRPFLVKPGQTWSNRFPEVKKDVFERLNTAKNAWFAGPYSERQAASKASGLVRRSAKHRYGASIQLNQRKSTKAEIKPNQG